MEIYYGDIKFFRKSDAPDKRLDRLTPDLELFEGNVERIDGENGNTFLKRLPVRAIVEVFLDNEIAPVETRLFGKDENLFQREPGERAGREEDLI
jgi:hypothetical protein